MLKTLEIYPSFTASLLRAIRNNIDNQWKSNLIQYCRSRLSGRYLTADPELRAAVVGPLLASGNLTWTQTVFNLTWKQSWWVRSVLIKDLNAEFIGKPSYENLVTTLVRDSSVDTSVVAAEVMVAESIDYQGQIEDANIVAQYSLRNAGKVGRVQEGTCRVSGLMVRTLGPAVSQIQWKKILGPTYSNFLSRTVRWAAYEQTDATAFVNISDTINDLVLDRVFQHDTSIGTRRLGNFGAAIEPNSRFARRYPEYFKAVINVHSRRVASDLSHAVTRSTGKHTKPVRFKDIPVIKKSLASGFLDLWSKW